MRRAVPLVLAVCNVVATVAALVGAKAVLSNPGSLATFSSPAAVAAADNEEAVTAFYAAINEAIHTGDASPLDALVAPGVDWCNQCPGHASDRAGLKQYLTDLHRSSPEMRLVVDQVAGGLLETVTVRVHVSGFPIAGTAAQWGPVDALRLVDGQIAERRSGAGRRYPDRAVARGAASTRCRRP